MQTTIRAFAVLAFAMLSSAVLAQTTEIGENCVNAIKDEYV